MHYVVEEVVNIDQRGLCQGLRFWPVMVVLTSRGSPLPFPLFEMLLLDIIRVPLFVLCVFPIYSCPVFLSVFFDSTAVPLAVDFMDI